MDINYFQLITNIFAIIAGISSTVGLIVLLREKFFWLTIRLAIQKRRPPFSGITDQPPVKTLTAQFINRGFMDIPIYEINIYANGELLPIQPDISISNDLILPQTNQTITYNLANIRKTAREHIPTRTKKIKLRIELISGTLKTYRSNRLQINLDDHPHTRP